MQKARRNELSLSDRLSHLTYAQACKLLAPRGKELLLAGGTTEIEIDHQVELGRERFVLALPGSTVTIRLADAARLRLAIECSDCSQPCVHAGAALSLILEEKTLLGLAAPPPERIPAERLEEGEIDRRALAERLERAREERMTVRSADPKRPWTDYRVTSPASGRSYRVALRGRERGESYCSCPDFRKNTLGTCKHVLHVQGKVERRFTRAQLARPYRRRGLSLYLHYAEGVELRLGVPKPLDPAVERIVRPFLGRPIEDLRDLLERLKRLERLEVEVAVYPDAEEFIQRRLLREGLAHKAAEIRANPARHRLRRELVASELLPYQLDGIAFAVGAGRAILADDMGLGKTIQGIGVAELLRRMAGISRVLVVCPASLKAQWRSEIQRFSNHDCTLVLGGAEERRDQYAAPTFFTLCNYEQVLRDLTAIEAQPWDLIVLDEAQRIKNWEAKTSRAVKALRSRFALALTGTPIENRIDDLYSIVEFVDERRLGPGFRFFSRHRTANDSGKVLGYENLGDLRRTLEPVLLRRTRGSVMQDLPPRSTEVIRVEPTREQAELHGGYMQTVSAIVRKKFISEMDLLRLRKALLMCRLAADATSLVDKRKPGHSSKLAALRDLLANLLAEPERKIVLFSEWTSMLDLVEEQLLELGAQWVRLDGKVPQAKRRARVETFQRDPACRVFLTSNAGSTGLNLQAADTVVNVDLPWNPAVLEQRIGRAHRMGQERPVQVYVLVTEETIEENLLATLSSKRELFEAVLDPDSDVEAVDVLSNVEDLRSRLEVLLGAKPPEPVSEVEQRMRDAELDGAGRGARVSEAFGTLVSAAFSLLGEMLPEPGDQTQRRGPTSGANGSADRLRAQLFDGVEEDSQGRPQLTITLPDKASLDALAGTLVKLIESTAHSAPDGALGGSNGGIAR
jgi:superfamily II DNA or RNA helicase